MEEANKEDTPSSTAKPASGLAIRASQVVSRATTSTSSLMANAAAVALGSIPSVSDVQLQEHDPIRLQDFLFLRDADIDGIVSTSEVNSATTSSKNSVISCGSDMSAEVDLAQHSPEEREKHMVMLRKRREEKKRNAVIDVLDGAFGPTALLSQRVERRGKAERVLKGLSDIGESSGLAKMPDHPSSSLDSDGTGKEISPVIAGEENTNGEEVNVREDKEQD